MIIVLLLQNGECHISSYRQTNGNYRTICSKTVDKNSNTNTLSADDIFPGTCSICKRYYDEMYSEDSSSKSALVRLSSTSSLKSVLDHHRAGVAGPEIDYYDIDERRWYKLSKYQRLIPKAKSKKRKSNKYMFLTK